MDHIVSAEFNGMPLSIIDHSGQKWLTASQAGQCLGYDESNARNRITKIFERHGDEFSDTDSRTVNLTARDGRPRPTRIFSATGCIKLGFFANTPRAKDFRAWASKTLAGQPVAVVAAPPAADLALAREIGSLRDELRAQNSMILSLYNRLDTARRGHLRALGSLAGIHKNQAAADAKALVLELEAQGVPRDEIARRTGKTLNHIRQIVYRDRHGVPSKQGELALGGQAC
ncbi:BRO family protein [Azonexus sp.]|uniref:BRO family protein n=1 Tax=Azonexus sp. TaxID=1872668 RepID=UPI0039E4E19D